MHLVLYEPEIPPNTGNIARLCAATNTELNLIKPLGFSLADRYLKRAGLDYWQFVKLRVWESFDEYLKVAGRDMRIVATSARGGVSIQSFEFTPKDAFVFGPETRGLPENVLSLAAERIKIPIQNVRSLNLSTSAGIVLYTALMKCNLLDF